ncbi:unnamed protein product [Thelazia callipaeda]|uniref:Uncharacterized protein n=1 Tax=Thelazia callipaeda TaxID=103827 RepID=A0A0N5CLV0_THECL|nr:unnamed protein product [Thelazia callipaeda]
MSPIHRRNTASYRSEYPYGDLRIDKKTGEEYNPCHSFVEPCFGIPVDEYRKNKGNNQLLINVEFHSI